MLSLTLAFRPILLAPLNRFESATNVSPLPFNVELERRCARSGIDPIRCLIDSTMVALLRIGERNGETKSGRLLPKKPKRDREDLRDRRRVFRKRHARKFAAFGLGHPVFRKEVRACAAREDHDADKFPVFPGPDLYEFPRRDALRIVPMLTCELGAFVSRPGDF